MDFNFFVFSLIRERIELTETYRIQKYSWPHLMRGNSALIINAAGTGKTLAYLPAIFSIILVSNFLFKISSKFQKFIYSVKEALVKFQLELDQSQLSLQDHPEKLNLQFIV